MADRRARTDVAPVGTAGRRYSLVLHRHVRPAAVEDGVQVEPGQIMLELAAALDARVHAPGDRPVTRMDTLLGRLFGGAGAWALARHLARELGPQDVVFCNSEVVGYPLAALLGRRRRGRAKVAIFVHNSDRPRARAALRLFGLRRRTDRFLACSEQQLRFLSRFLRLPPAAAAFVCDTTDTAFFTPGEASPDKRRPMVVSVGLEQRDYRTLAEATHDLDLDVRISAFSADATTEQRALPESLPANMQRRFYAWPELVQLYRDADVVVVPLFENGYAAGVQALMEGLCCGRPVIVTRTSGLTGYLGPEVSSVPPQNVVALRQAIRTVLDDPATAEERAARGQRLAAERYAGERYVGTLVEILRGL